MLLRLQKLQDLSAISDNNDLSLIVLLKKKQKKAEPAQKSSSSSASQWKGEKRRIDEAMLTKYLVDNELNDSILHTCGLTGMIKAMQDLLHNDIRIPKEQIRVEEFTGY
jgi:Oxidoreductase NAD-binding domain